MEDLLYLSSEMTGFSVHVIGACLGLPPTNTGAIVSLDGESDRDKIHRLLVQWREAKGETCTWSILAKCLQGLNNPSLMKALDEYLKGKKSGVYVCVDYRSAHVYFHCFIK